MNHNEVLRRLQGRFNDWALSDSQREISEDFPFLRRVAWSLPIKTIAVMRSLPLEARQQLGSALVRTHRVCINPEEVGARLTADSDGMLAWYFERMRLPVREVMEADSPEKWATYVRDKRELMQSVRGELMAAFPGQAPRKSRSELHFHTCVHRFDIETIVYTGNSWQLWYYHRLRHIPSGVDVRDISLLSWLGISSVTYWYYVTEASIPETAKAVGDLCRHFVAAADHFLAGLIDGQLS